LTDIKRSSNYVKREAVASRVNPWAHTLATTIQMKNKTVAFGQSKTIIDTKTGELTGETAVVAIRDKVDRTEFIKIFEGGIANIFNLNKAAKDLFQAILMIYLNQKMKSELVYISEVVLEDVGYKRTKQTRIPALNKLLNLGFLCEVEGQPNQFWINPNMFFKGDRMQIFRDIVVKGTAAADEQQKEIDAIESKNKQMELI